MTKPLEPDDLDHDGYDLKPPPEDRPRPKPEPSKTSANHPSSDSTDSSPDPERRGLPGVTVSINAQGVSYSAQFLLGLALWALLLVSFWLIGKYQFGMGIGILPLAGVSFLVRFMRSNYGWQGFMPGVILGALVTTLIVFAICGLSAGIH